jgi:hypothetical protein
MSFQSKNSAFRKWQKPFEKQNIEGITLIELLYHVKNGNIRVRFQNKELDIDDALAKIHDVCYLKNYKKIHTIILQ